MPSRTLRIALLVLASTVLLSRAYPKAQENEEELEATKRTLVEEEDDADLLESALAATDIPEEMETTAELNEGKIGVLRPATSRRWKRFTRRFERGVRRAWTDVKPYMPLIMHGLFPELMDSVAAEMGLPEEYEEKTQDKIVLSASRPVEKSVRRVHLPQTKISEASVVSTTKPSSSQSQNSGYRIKYFIVITGICIFLR